MSEASLESTPHTQQYTLSEPESPKTLLAISHRGAPEMLQDDIQYFLTLVRRVLAEDSPRKRDAFDELLIHIMTLLDAVETHHAKQSTSVQSISYASDCVLPKQDKATNQTLETFRETFDALSNADKRQLMRAYVAFFHLANICEEHYRVRALEDYERTQHKKSAHAPHNDLTRAFAQLTDEVGSVRAHEILAKLEFRPVFTAHPTEARRKATEGKIRRIYDLLIKRDTLGGAELDENERALLQEIDALIRTSPIAAKKPTPVEEADTILDIFDHTLFNLVPELYQRFDTWLLGDQAGTVPAICPAFIHPGSWIGTDRDGNPNVTAKVSRQVAEKYRVHVLEALCNQTLSVGRNLTLDIRSTPPSKELLNVWNHQVEMSENLSRAALEISTGELHRAVMMVITDRLNATISRTADFMYTNVEEYLDDLRCVQSSLAQAGAKRSAYGPLQHLIWQVETFGFHLVEMEFRQHSLVHRRALADIEKHGRHGQRGALDPMTTEVLDTFRAIRHIQRRNGVSAARRYIVSFTQSAQDIKNVYLLAEAAFAHRSDVPTLDVIPLFEQVEDLTAAVSILDEMIELPAVRKRLEETGRRLEVMLGYSDSSKDAGPTSATLVLDRAQAEIAQWAQARGIDLVLMHGRGGAVGRGGGPANRAVLAQPKGSVNSCFKLTEQGEVIFARYGNPSLARRHIESVAGATLMHAAPSVAKRNTDSAAEFKSLADVLDTTSRTTYLDLLETPGFVEWFACVTPLHEIGLLPLGSRPAHRGLGATSLADLRAIPWTFSWSQARINLPTWYGLGSACEAVGDLDLLRRAYQEWPLFTTFIDNIEMSLSKTDAYIAQCYLELADRPDLNTKVYEEWTRAMHWVLAIVQNSWPLEHRRILGPLVRMRLPFVNVLSAAQAHVLALLRHNSDMLSDEEQEEITYLLLCTVSGVAAGLQNTG